MKAFADHGSVGTPRWRPTAAIARACWRNSRGAGIDVDALAARLQSEGAAAFVKSWNELMAVIAGKSAALHPQARGAESARTETSTMNVLVVDIGGTHVKILATGQTEPRRFESGPDLTAEEMVAGVKECAEGWHYDVVSIGYPGVVIRNRPVAEPHNLGFGWVGFDYAKAFGCPVKMINDAAMQALGSYQGGKLLFLGLGTGLGTAMIVDGIVEPMELGHAPYKRGTYEDYVGIGGFKRLGKKKWRKNVAEWSSPFSSRRSTRPTSSSAAAT